MFESDALFPNDSGGGLVLLYLPRASTVGRCGRVTVPGIDKSVDGSLIRQMDRFTSTAPANTSKVADHTGSKNVTAIEYLNPEYLISNK